MLPEIKIGMKVKCLNCGESIKLNENNFTMDFDAEYIECPHCQKVYDVQVYHMRGELFKKVKLYKSCFVIYGKFYANQRKINLFAN